jgi:hypothetical protein
MRTREERGEGERERARERERERVAKAPAIREAPGHTASACARVGAFLDCSLCLQLLECPLQAPACAANYWVTYRELCAWPLCKGDGAWPSCKGDSAWPYLDVVCCFVFLPAVAISADPAAAREKYAPAVAVPLR